VVYVAVGEPVEGWLRCREVGNAVAENDLAEAHTEVEHRGEEDSALVVAELEQRRVEEDRIDRLAEAKSIAVGPVVVDLSRVSLHTSVHVIRSSIPYPPFSGGAEFSQFSSRIAQRKLLTRIEVPAWRISLVS
jgi:hypothetical protein